MKRCSRCTKRLPLTAFNKNTSRKDGLNTFCRTCACDASREYYRNNRAKHKAYVSKQKKITRERVRQNLWDYLVQHPCIVCGVSDPRVLEFAHRDASTKLDDVAQMVSRAVSWERIYAEIQKCDVKCANCHRLQTQEQQNSYKHKFGLVAQLVEQRSLKAEVASSTLARPTNIRE